jgi:hypothetical protein
MGHAKRAQDLLYQTIRESGIALAVIAEPYSVPESTNWAQDTNGRVAITWTPVLGPHGVLLDRGNGYVAVEWAGIAVVGIYVSPNCGLEAFGDFLDEVGDCVRRCYPRQVLVLGDFNAHSTLWGNDRTTTRGRWLTDCAAGHGLALINKGTIKTCVAWRGASVVDLTLATPELYRKIRNWHVAEGVETLSDHLYVCMELKLSKDSDSRTEVKRTGTTPPRWRLKDRDKEALQVVATGTAWSWDARDVSKVRTVDNEANDLQKQMRIVCDAAMPRVSKKNKNTRRTMYWWNPEIAELREQCNQARRRFARAQRRRWTRSEEEISRTYATYRRARKVLQREIKIAKESWSQSWKKLIESVESDPWGRPYKVVLFKLKPPVPPQTESMDPETLDKVIGTLFPKQEARPRKSECFPSLSHSDSEEEEEDDTSEWREEDEITNEELTRAVRKMASRDVAPGPDGIPGRIWAETIDLMAPHLRHLFNRCMREGAYPRSWRVARLVLLRKEGRPPDSPSGYRPICLLDEVGKLFERIIAARIEAHMRQRESGWHDRQYGFRQGSSTIDAIIHA